MKKKMVNCHMQPRTIAFRSGRWRLRLLVSCASSLIQAVSLLGLASSLGLAAAEAREISPKGKMTFDIAGPSLVEALMQFTEQSGLQLMVPTGEETEVSVRKVVGSYTPRAALEQLLAGTAFKYEFANPRTVAIRLTDAESPSRATDRSEQDGSEAAATSLPSSQQSTAGDVAPRQAIPQILVKGSRSMDVDIRRTEDDVQPYVVFDQKEIEKSQAATVEDFLRSRLSMNTQQGASGQAVLGTGNRSQFNLRGLGTNQTLVLVDGRRLPGTYGRDASSNLTFNQPDLNGIPLSLIERIEVLPATASGIYGGGATGGVINVVLKRNYQGFELRGAYGNTFDSAAGDVQVSASGGFELEDGRTNVLVNVSHYHANDLSVGERDFVARARERQFVSNPSQFFGSPFSVPLGYTTNISSADGTNLVLKNGNVPLNSPRTFVPVGYAGPANDGGTALIANAGQYNLVLPNDVTGDGQALLATPTVDSVSINPRRQFGRFFEAFLDLSWTRNRGETAGVAGLTSSIVLPATATSNPFTRPIRVTFAKPGLSFPVTVEDKTQRATGGAIVHLPNDWSFGADFTWSRVRTLQKGTALAISPAGNTALANGTLNVMRDLNQFPMDYSGYLLTSPNSVDGPTDVVLKDLPLRISGTLFRIPGGNVALTGLAEYRKEEAQDSFVDQVNVFSGAPQTLFRAGRSQSVRSYALEVQSPLISSSNALFGMRALDVQAAIRRDSYKTQSASSAGVVVPSRDSPIPPAVFSENALSATKYTLGLRYVPITDVTLRASTSTGFLPPSIGQIVSTTPISTPVFVVQDPKRGGAPSSGNLLITAGGNSKLQPEESKSFSAGAIVEPQFAPGWRFSIDYTRVKKTAEITSLTAQQIVDLEDGIPGRVSRGANLSTDQPGWAGPITGIDLTSVNIAETRVDAYDFQLDYSLQTEAIGRFEMAMGLTRQNNFERKLAPTSSAVDSVGYFDGNLKWRGNLGITWLKGPWTVGWNAQYYDSYFVYSSTQSSALRASAALSQGSEAIPSQMYHDAFAAYKASEAQGPLLSGTRIVLGVQNVFDRSPPIIATTGTFGGYSTYGDPRLRRFSVSIAKHF